MLRLDFRRLKIETGNLLGGNCSNPGEREGGDSESRGQQQRGPEVLELGLQFKDEPTRIS